MGNGRWASTSRRRRWLTRSGAPPGAAPQAAVGRAARRCAMSERKRHQFTRIPCHDRTRERDRRRAKASPAKNILVIMAPARGWRDA
jgi:hypothetical protein